MDVVAETRRNFLNSDCYQRYKCETPKALRSSYKGINYALIYFFRPINALIFRILSYKLVNFF